MPTFSAARTSCTALIFAALTIGTLAGVSGCASGNGPRTGARAGTVDPTNYVALFQAGEYQSAYDRASIAATSKNTARKSEAALIAGLSAQALSKNADAVHWLTPLRDDGDAQIAGRSCAALGLIAQERGEHESAAQLLTRAGKKLSGDESARSWMYAGDSLRAAGKGKDASDAYTRAQQAVESDTSLRTMIGDRLAGNTTANTTPRTGTIGYPGAATISTNTAGSLGAASNKLTVQAGAYSSLATAQRTTQQLARKGQASRIVQINKNGRTLYAVRVGSFTSKSAADSVQKTVGGGAIVTAE